MRQLRTFGVHVVPQKFSDSAISNLMLIGQFTTEDKHEDRTQTEQSTQSSI